MAAIATEYRTIYACTDGVVSLNLCSRSRKIPDIGSIIPLCINCQSLAKRRYLFYIDLGIDEQTIRNSSISCGHPPFIPLEPFFLVFQIPS